jgi:hypothetical protein
VLRNTGRWGCRNTHILHPKCHKISLKSVALPTRPEISEEMAGICQKCPKIVFKMRISPQRLIQIASFKSQMVANITRFPYTPKQRNLVVEWSQFRQFFPDNHRQTLRHHASLGLGASMYAMKPSSVGEVILCVYWEVCLLQRDKN